MPFKESFEKFKFACRNYRYCGSGFVQRKANQHNSGKNGFLQKEGMFLNVFPPTMLVYFPLHTKLLCIYVLFPKKKFKECKWAKDNSMLFSIFNMYKYTHCLSRNSSCINNKIFIQQQKEKSEFTFVSTQQNIQHTGY